MLFQKKFDRAMNLMKEKNSENDTKFQDFNEELELEKNDKLAMLLGAFMVFIPTAVIILGIFALITWLFTLM